MAKQMAKRDVALRLGWRTIDRLSRLSLAAVIVVAVAARLVAGMAFSAASTDTYEFGQIAENVADGHGYAYLPADGDRALRADQGDEATRWIPSAYMPPLYTYTVVAARLVAGDSTASLVWTVRGVNLVMSCLGLAAVHALTRRLVQSRRAATLAALGFAVYPPLVYAATQVSASNLYVPIETAALLALLAAARNPSWRPWGVAAIVMGLLALVRAEALLLIPLVAAWLWWGSRSASPAVPARTRALLAAGFVMVAAVLPAAWLVRNSVTFGEPTMTIATSGGANLWIGNHEGASGSQKSFDVAEDIRAELDAMPADDDYELRSDAVFRREAIDSVVGDPLGTIARDVKKLGLLLGADIYDKRSLNPAALGGWAVLAVVGTLGLLEWWRLQDRPTRVLIGGFIAINIAIPVIFFALSRYRLPIEVTLLSFAGAWLATRAERDRTASAPPLATPPRALPVASRSAT